VLPRLPHILRRQDGFSFIELLIVMILLGILAAIVIPAFLSQTSQGGDASAKSDARSMADAVENCSAEGNDYTQCDKEAELGGNPGLNWGAGPRQVQVLSAGEREYQIRAVSSDNHEFIWTKLPNGRVERSCSPQGKGGCDDAGNW
jgi:type IV pilus assembly protein PilA